MVVGFQSLKFFISDENINQRLMVVLHLMRYFILNEILGLERLNRKVIPLKGKNLIKKI